MATTWIKPLHRAGGKNTASALNRSAEYILDPKKTRDGELVDSYECHPQTAQAEFLLSKKLYAQKTGRDQGKNDVIAYHIRMSFKENEVTPEKALELGRELAMRWTRGKHQFVVAAHTNTNNPHVHIIYNSVTLDCDRKYQDFLHSYKTLRRISDQICLENGLAVIENPGLSKGYNREDYLHARDSGDGVAGTGKPPSVRDKLRNIIDNQLAQVILAQEKTPHGVAAFEDFIAAMKNTGCEVKRGKHLAFKIPEGQRFIRCKSLGEDYEEVALLEKLSSIRATGQKKSSVAAAQLQSSPPIQKPNLLINIQSKLQQAHSPGFEHWARIYNLKEMAKTLLSLQENGLDSYDALVEKGDAVSISHNKRSKKIKEIEAKQKEVSKLQKHIGTYSKTKETYSVYRKMKNEPQSAWSKFRNEQHPAEIFYENNRANITLHEAAKKYFDEQGYVRGSGNKLPSIQSLKTEYAKLVAQKKKLWSGYRTERDEMVALKMAKQNVDIFFAEPKQVRNPKSHEHSL